MNNELKHNEKRKPHLVMGVMKRFFDLDLAMKLSILFCGMIFVVLIFTALVLFSSGQRYVQNEQETRSIQTLEYVQIMIEKEQKYLEGLTEYYSSSVDAQELVQRSNNGMQIQPELFQELLKSARFKMYLLSVVFYNRKGDPIFLSIIHMDLFLRALESRKDLLNGSCPPIRTWNGSIFLSTLKNL